MQKPTLVSRIIRVKNVFHVAVKYHKIDTNNLILNHPHIFKIIANPDDEGYIPLNLTVSSGHFDTTEESHNRQDLLIYIGIDITASTKKRKTIIHLAATTNVANFLALVLEVPNAL